MVSYQSREVSYLHSVVASLSSIVSSREALRIPVIANGNIQFHCDIERCLNETGVDGVMSAEGILYNPSLFSGIHEPCWKLAREYFDLFNQHHDLEVSRSCLRAHLFKIMHHALQIEGNERLRDDLSSARTYEEFSTIIDAVKDLYQTENEDQSMETSTLPLPFYISQPYFRPKPSGPQSDPKNDEVPRERIKRMSDDTIKVCGALPNLSKKQARKLLKIQGRKERKENKRKLDGFLPCEKCDINARGLKCSRSLCKQCCIYELKKDLTSSCPSMSI